MLKLQLVDEFGDELLLFQGSGSNTALLSTRNLGTDEGCSVLLTKAQAIELMTQLGALIAGS